MPPDALRKQDTHLPQNANYLKHLYDETPCNHSPAADGRHDGLGTGAGRGAADTGIPLTGRQRILFDDHGARPAELCQVCGQPAAVRTADGMDRAERRAAEHTRRPLHGRHGRAEQQTHRRGHTQPQQRRPHLTAAVAGRIGCSGASGRQDALHLVSGQPRHRIHRRRAPIFTDARLHLPRTQSGLCRDIGGHGPQP